MPGDCRDTEACNGLPFNSHSSGGSHGELISVYSIMKAIRVCPVCPVCGDSSHPRLARSSPHLFLYSSHFLPSTLLMRTAQERARERKQEREEKERLISSGDELSLKYLISHPSCSSPPLFSQLCHYRRQQDSQKPQRLTPPTHLGSKKKPSESPDEYAAAEPCRSWVWS